MGQGDDGVVDRTDEHRFVLERPEGEAELEYNLHGDRLVLIHTEVPDALEGQGIGGKLVRAAVDRATAERLTVVPTCPFARSWLERHPDDIAGLRVDWGAGGQPSS